MNFYKENEETIQKTKQILDTDKLNAYFESINKTLKNMKNIIQYDLQLGSHLNFEYGITNNNFGSVYSPVGISDEISGNATVIWDNGTVSLIDLDYDKIIRFPELIDFFKSLSYPEKFLPRLPENQSIVPYKSFDPELFERIYSREFPLFQNMGQNFKLLKKPESDFVNIAADYSLSYELYGNSKNINIQKIYTSNSFSYEVDSLVFQHILSHLLFDQKKIDSSFTPFHNFFINLKKTTSEKMNNENIVLLPSALYPLLSFYLGYNMNGQNIYYKKSQFSLEDFDSGRKISNKAFNLLFNPTLDWEMSSYCLSSSGLTPETGYYIKEGKMTQPSIDLKASAMLNRKPNNGFGGGKTIFEPVDDTLINYLEKTGDFYLVFGFLGLHTQDPLSGNFSLSVSTGLLKQKGKIRGLTKANVSGNIFDLLKEGSFKILENGYDEKFSMVFPMKANN